MSETEKNKKLCWEEIVNRLLTPGNIHAGISLDAIRWYYDRAEKVEIIDGKTIFTMPPVQCVPKGTFPPDYVKPKPWWRFW